MGSILSDVSLCAIFLLLFIRPAESAYAPFQCVDTPEWRGGQGRTCADYRNNADLCGRYPTGQAINNCCVCGGPLSDANIKSAVVAWRTDPALTEGAYGSIEDWGVSEVTDFHRLFAPYASYVNGAGVPSPTYIEHTKQVALNSCMPQWSTGGNDNNGACTTRSACFVRAVEACASGSSCTGFALRIKCDELSGNCEGYALLSTACTTADLVVNEYWSTYLPSGEPEAAKSFNADLSKWAVGKVQDMRYCFESASSFNSDLSAWDLTKAINIAYMFRYAAAFSGDISAWNTGSVTSLYKTFEGASAFNADLSNWNVGQVKDMRHCFNGASSFNSALNAWDLAKVTTIANMFRDAKSFSGDISAWNTAKVKSLYQTFQGASAFNADLSKWDLAKVTTIAHMFKDAKSFSGDISAWNIGSVTSLYETFQGASAFNADLSNWNIGQVTEMRHCFNGASSFNSDLSLWDLSKVTNIANMFRDAKKFSGEISAWNTGSVTSLFRTFQGASAFNGELSNWNVGKVINTQECFVGSERFNQDLSNWNVVRVTNMDNMFEGASSFAVYLCGSAWYNTEASKKNMFRDSKGGSIACDCSAGLYSMGDPSGDEAGCAGKCPKGKWSTAAGITSIDGCEDRLCPAGGYTTKAGLSAVADCVDEPCINEAYYVRVHAFLSLPTIEQANTGLIAQCPAGSTAPIPVDDGYFSIPETNSISNRTGQSACDENANQFCAGGVRSTTPPGYYREGQESSLIECPLGFYCSGGDKTECEKNRGYYCPIRSFAQFLCEPGYFCPSPKVRHECSEGQACPVGSMKPEACPQGKQGVTTRRLSECVDCPPGKERSAGADANVSNVDELVCTPCKGWKHAREPGMRACLECKNGTVAVQEEGANRCRPCGSGTRSSDDHSSCIECSAGYFSRGLASTCARCDAGFVSDDRAESCVACEGGRASNFNRTECAVCEAGRAASAAAGECEACRPGEYTENAEEVVCRRCLPGTKASQENSGATGCEDCKNGEFQDQAGQTQCKQCDPIAGSVDSGGSLACNSCPSGTFTESSTSSCVQCVTGEFSPGGDVSSCVQCPSGEFADEAGSATCTRCLPGTRANKPDGGATGCEHCESGEFQDQAGQTQCKKCDPIAGSVVPNGSLACNPCPPGSFLNNESSRCERCQAGTYSIGGTVTSCAICDTGSSKEGSAFCDDCRSGTFLNTTKRPPTCDDCHPGFFSDNAASECTPCEDGYVATRLGSRLCSACRAGTFAKLDHTECIACAAGSISKTGADFCTPCGAGTWQNGTDCVACPAGYYGNRTGLTDATCDGACPPGTHSYRYATKCQDCEAGKHASNSSMEDCVFCDDAEGLVPSLDATSCVCKQGAFRTAGNECELCTDGMACTEIGVSVETLALREGFWRQDTTTSTVIKCPFPDACAGVNTTCAPGNEGVLCAVCSDGFYRPSKLGGCADCDANPVAAWATLIGSIAGILLVFSAIILMNRRMNNGLLRPLVSSAQNLCAIAWQIMLLFDAPFPASIKNLFALFAAFSVGFDVLQSMCLGGLSSLTYYDSLAALLTLTILVVLALCMPSVREKVREGLTWGQAVATDCGSRTIKDCFVFVLLVHPVLSGKAMEFFRCQEIEGEWYLMVDYSVQCYDSKWYTFLPVALLVLIAFALGTPVSIFAVLWPRRTSLFDPETERAIDHPLDVLYRPYRPSAWYFESVNMLYKVALWCALVYFENGSVGQLLAAVAVNMAMLCVIIHVKPMGSRDAHLLNTLQILICILLTSLAVGGTAMNALEVNNELARREDDETAIKDNTGMIRVIQVLLELFVYALLSCTVLYGLNRVYRKLPRHSGLRKAVDKAFATLCQGVEMMEFQQNPMRPTGQLSVSADVPELPRTDGKPALNQKKSRHVSVRFGPTVEIHE